jgi:tRNA (mo5U34)-methyltransferase
MIRSRGRMTVAELRAEVIRLGPWHIDVEITPEVSTRASLDAPPGTYPESFGRVKMYDPREGFLRRLGRLFPEGLAGRSVLDCGCNCGAYSFYAREAGAGRCFGLDVREHWIQQARFLAAQRPDTGEGVRFEVADLYALPNLELGRFDVTLFLGIFYHLFDPVAGLRLAADLTDELLIVNSATKASLPDGLLVSDHESPELADAGVDDLCWFPTGPAVLARILGWLGFPEVRCSVWRRAPRQRKDLERVEVLAARTPGFFAAWDAGRPDGPMGLADAIETATPPGATVLVVASESVEARGREAIALRGPDPSELERGFAAGARYLVVPVSAREQGHTILPPSIEARAQVILDDATCRIYAIGD